MKGYIFFYLNRLLAGPPPPPLVDTTSKSNIIIHPSTRAPMTPAPICCFLSFLRPSKLLGMYALGPVSPADSSAAVRAASAASTRSWAPASPRANAAFASSSSLLAESWAQKVLKQMVNHHQHQSHISLQN